MITQANTVLRNLNATASYREDQTTYILEREDIRYVRLDKEALYVDITMSDGSTLRIERQPLTSGLAARVIADNDSKVGPW